MHSILIFLSLPPPIPEILLNIVTEAFMTHCDPHSEKRHVCGAGVCEVPGGVGLCVVLHSHQLGACPSFGLEDSNGSLSA